LNLANYFPVLLFILVGMGVGLVPMFLGKILAPSKPDAEKLSPYECGFEAFEDARMKFDVRYYLIAILFILFDLETAFLFPWGVALRDIGWLGYFWNSLWDLFISGKRALSTGSDRYGIRRRSQRRICHYYC
jgi:NADH-quinone oxidoreductase subunit A